MEALSFPDPNPTPTMVVDQPTIIMQVRREELRGLPSAKRGLADATMWFFSADPRAFSSHDGKNYTVCRDSEVGCGGVEKSGGAYRQWRARGACSSVLPSYRRTENWRLGVEL